MEKILRKMLCFGLLVAIVSSVLAWTTPSTTAAPDGYEPNNSIDLATEITPGLYTGLTIESIGDEDYYNITLSAGDEIAVTIFNMGTMFDLYLLDSLGTTQNSSTSGLSDSEKVWWFNVPTSGNCTIRVDGVGTDQGSYDMKIEAPVIDDTSEDNDDFTSATPVTNTTTLTDLQLYDQDYYSLTLGAGDLLQATVDRSGFEAGGNFTLGIYDSSYILRVNTEIEVGTSNYVIIQAKAYGSFYVIIERSLPNSWGNYSLILQSTTDDAYEDNDVLGEAFHVDIDNITIMQALSSGSLVLNDEDWFSYTLNAGESFYAVISTSNTNLATQIISQTGLVLDNSKPFTGSPTIIVNCTIPATGNYSIRVYPTAWPHSMSYGLLVARFNVTHPADITYQPGQTGSIIIWCMDDTYFGFMPYNPSYEPMFRANIYLDGFLLANTYYWNRTKNVSLSVDGLPEGNHSFRIVVNNPANLTLEDTVIVTVKSVATSDPDGCNPDPNPDGGIPGYPVAILGGFMLVGILALAARKRRGYFRN